jgi:hypothetical protein
MPIETWFLTGSAAPFDGAFVLSSLGGFPLAADLFVVPAFAVCWVRVRLALAGDFSRSAAECRLDVLFDLALFVPASMEMVLLFVIVWDRS